MKSVIFNVEHIGVLSDKHHIAQDAPIAVGRFFATQQFKRAFKTA
jgi:hypothetical protein